MRPISDDASLQLFEFDGRSFMSPRQFDGGLVQAIDFAQLTSDLGQLFQD